MMGVLIRTPIIVLVLLLHKKFASIDLVCGAQDVRWGMGMQQQDWTGRRLCVTARVEAPQSSGQRRRRKLLFLISKLQYNHSQAAQAKMAPFTIKAWLHWHSSRSRTSSKMLRLHNSKGRLTRYMS